MPIDWLKQLRTLIDLADDRIRRLESGEPAGDTTQRTIEAERAMIARLQQTIDALNANLAIGRAARARR